MESGFKRLFSRKRSKSKPLSISTPLSDTFQQTTGYDGFTAGAPPMIGDLPIKPSEQNAKRRSFSHNKTKSVGSQEFGHLVHTDSNVRPGTAPGAHPPSIDLLDFSKIRQQARASQDAPRMRSKSIQVPPKMPDLPKGLAEMGGPKSFDLLQAAISSSKARAPPNSTRQSFDYYNESIADRNSLYGKLPKLPMDKNVAKVSMGQGESNATSSHTLDNQRASFDAMRASRAAKLSAGRVGSRIIGVDMPRAPPEVNDFSNQSLAKDATGQNMSGFNQKDILAPRTSSESRRSRKKSVRQTNLPPQLSPIPQEKSSPAVVTAALPSPAESSKLSSERKRSKTVPAASNLSGISAWGQSDAPAILTLQPFEEDLQQTAANASPLLPSPPSTAGKNHSTSPKRDQMSGGLPPDIVSDQFPPRMSSDRSTRKGEQIKYRPRDPATISINAQANAVIRNASRNKATPSRRVMNLRADGAERPSEEEDDNDYDVGIEEAVTRQADPVQMLRASVVSANDYVYKGGDNVILGKVLHHRSSRGLSLSEPSGLPSTVTDSNLGTRSEGRDDTSASGEPPSPTLITSTKSAMESQLDFEGRRPTTSQPSPSSPSPIAAADSLKVPQQEPPEARTSLPKARNHGEKPPAQRNLQYVQHGTAQQPHFSAPAGESLPTGSVGTVTSAATTQHYADVPPSAANTGSMPTSADVLTRDFAHAQTPPPGFPHPRMTSMAHDTKPITGRYENSTFGGYISIREKELEFHSSAIDRSIAIKKEAAAKALLKLQEVMAMPTWEESPDIGRPVASTKVPSHWRGLSIEDGGPIAPSAIFKKVKIPIRMPPHSTHSTFSGKGQLDRKSSNEKLVNGATEGNSAPSLPAATNDVSLDKAQMNDSVAPTAPSDPTEPPSLERRGRSDTAVPQTKGSHSRMGSTVSATSGTSAYSLPYHMVPARSSSMRDSDGSIGDMGSQPGFHVGELGWH